MASRFVIVIITLFFVCIHLGSADDSKPLSQNKRKIVSLEPSVGTSFQDVSYIREQLPILDDFNKPSEMPLQSSVDNDFIESLFIDEVFVVSIASSDYIFEDVLLAKCVPADGFWCDLISEFNELSINESEYLVSQIDSINAILPIKDLIKEFFHPRYCSTLEGLRLRLLHDDEEAKESLNKVFMLMSVKVNGCRRKGFKE